MVKDVQKNTEEATGYCRQVQVIISDRKDASIGVKADLRKDAAVLMK